MGFTTFLLSYQILVAHSLENKLKAEELSANCQVQRELDENLNERRELDESNIEWEQPHRITIRLPLPRFNFSSNHQNDVITPPPSYDVLTPPPTYDQVTEVFLFETKV